MVDTVTTSFNQILADQTPQPPTAATPSKRAIIIAALLLVAIGFCAYGRTLTTYFLADDFGEVTYVSRIIDGGRWDLFWSNWTGNFMQIPGMAVYRPFLLVSLLTDYAIWKTNATGFYLTNLLFYTGDVLLLFFVTLQLTREWSPKRSLLTAFSGAALFAVSPLHCETVSWVVGRVDSSCLLFSLASILCFLNANRKQSQVWLGACVTFFIGGLLFKEMAIGVPIVVTAIAVLWQQNWTDRRSWLAVIKQIAPIWIATAIYFVVRYLVLGTLTGGYSGAIGDGQAGSAIARWFDPQTYERVILPFAASFYRPDSPFVIGTKMLLAGAGTLIAVRALRGELPYRHIALLSAWLLSAAIPIYKLWGLGMDLQGARFVFFLTAPLSVILPVLLFAPGKEKNDRATFIVSTALMVLLGFVGYKVALHSNANWVHAGKEVKAVFASATSLAEANPGKKLIVLGIPKVKASAHMIYNGATFRTMLAPPFTANDISTRFITFDPIFYGPDQFINGDRFRKTLSAPDVAGAFVWDSDKKTFVRAPLTPGSIETVQPLELGSDNALLPGDSKSSDSVALALPHPINPWLYDYLEITFNKPETASAQDLRFFVSWRSKTGDAEKNQAERAIKANATAQTLTLRIPLSHSWRWFSGGDIERLTLKTPAIEGLKIQSARLVQAESYRPRLAIEARDDGSGVHAIDANARLHVNASSVPDAAKLLVECSKPDYFFDQVEESQQSTAVHKQFVHAGTTYDATLPPDFLLKEQYCELRARALNAAGEPIGEYSEPLILYLK